jgi:glutathione S-transferase
LYESRAICRYIAGKYANQGTSLVPTGTREKALFEQAASIEYCSFEPLASKAVGEMVFKPCAASPLFSSAGFSLTLASTPQDVRPDG